MALVGLGDYFATTALLEFSVFFLLPIWLFTWFVSRRAGLVASVASGIMIAVVNVTSATYLLHGKIAYWNAVVWMIGLAFALWIASSHVPEIREFVQRLPLLARDFGMAMRDLFARASTEGSK